MEKIITRHAYLQSMRALASRGGRRGGPARAAAMSARRRTEIAWLGALARWGKKKP